MRRVLVIDDELDVRDAIKRVLERAGCQVRVVDNANAAMEALAAQPADVVITDIIMPQINGVEAIQLIRTNHPEVRIIAISGGGNFGINSYQPSAITTTAYLAAASKAGADMTLTKPFETQELLTALARLTGTGSA
ncbi:MAG: response regulator [Steroidobacteraceae bacterium]